MKKILIIFSLIAGLSSYSQNYWSLFSDETIISNDVNQSKTFEIDCYKFKVIWNKKLSHSDNIGYYGGIETLTIYNNNKEIQTIKKIEDEIALGTIVFNFYDYNLDGHLDFTIPINSNWDGYYIYNPLIDKFEHQKEWDYLKIQKIDKVSKQILSQPDGNAQNDNRKRYQIKDNHLVLLSK